MVAGDLHFFGGDVARQTDGFHAVQQWPRNGVELVGGAHEQHLGQVEAHVEVMIQELDVLLGVEHFQQRRGRVALERRADLVDLVQHDHRVGGLGLAQCLDELARQRADVGAAMTLDLGLVAHSAQTEAVELAASASATERPMEVLPTPGGPTSRMIEPPTWPFSAPPPETR
jgi:hypothetical protein